MERLSIQLREERPVRLSAEELFFQEVKAGLFRQNLVLVAIELTGVRRSRRVERESPCSVNGKSAGSLDAGQSFNDDVVVEFDLREIQERGKRSGREFTSGFCGVNGKG